MARHAGAAGTPLPHIAEEALDRTCVNLPEDARGHVTLVGFAFRQNQQADLDSWLVPFAVNFGGRGDFLVYEVPMLGRAWRVLRRYINGGMRAGIEPRLHPRVLSYYGDVPGYRREAGMPDAGRVYVFLLDREGVIRWRGDGPSDPEQLVELYRQAESLAP
jgi:hypothetical protein